MDKSTKENWMLMQHGSGPPFVPKWKIRENEEGAFDRGVEAAKQMMLGGPGETMEMFETRKQSLQKQEAEEVIAKQKVIARKRQRQMEEERMKKEAEDAIARLKEKEDELTRKRKMKDRSWLNAGIWGDSK